MNINLEQKVVFIGGRWSWKTTVWREFANRISATFKDGDDATKEEMHWESIDEYVTRMNWFHFRKTIEHPAFKKLMNWETEVLALGWGTTTFWSVKNGNTGEEFSDVVNSEILKNSWAIVIYLRATPEVLAERIKNDVDSAENRPNLWSESESILEEAQRVYNERDPKYTQQATDVIDTVGKSIDEIVTEAMDIVSKKSA